MTNGKHTPGPWMHRVDTHGEGSGYLITDAAGAAVAVASPLVDKDGACRGDHPERDANARLIAAAPKMLEALNAASGWIDAHLFSQRAEIQATIREAIESAGVGAA